MPQRPRGTRDFAPDEAARRHRLAETFRAVFAHHGYKEVQTPTFEELELFTAKSGDGIISELYNFKDKGDRDMTLRPELTAPVMRMVFQDHAFDPKPLKWFYYGNCFRYDRPQTGRYREFWQFGCEQVGAGTPLAYAELIALGNAVLESAGLQEVDFQVGHVGILRAAVEAFGFDDETKGAMMRAIDKRDDAGMDEVAATKQGCEAALDRLKLLLSAADLAAARSAMADDDAVAPHFDELEAVLDHLEDFDVKVRLNLGIARGLDYYNGVVFEAHAPALEAQSQLLGGGGYDLSGLFDANPMPTMGFGLGFDRTLVALEAEGKDLGGADGVHVYFGSIGGSAQPIVVREATRLRRHGARVDMDLMGRKKADKIAKAADAADARFLVILGDRDLEAGQCQAKDLHTGQVTEVSIEAMGDWLLEQIGLDDLRDFN